MVGSGQRRGRGEVRRPVAHAGFDQGYLDTAERHLGRHRAGTRPQARRSDGAASHLRNIWTDPDRAGREEALKRDMRRPSRSLDDRRKSHRRDHDLAREPDSFPDDEVTLLAELAGDLAFPESLRSGAHAKAAAEQELRESEQRYRKPFESMDEALPPAR